MAEADAPTRRRPRLGVIVSVACLTLGLALLVALFARLDPTAVLATLGKVGWFFALGFGAHVLCQIVTTAAWRETLPPDHGVGFGRLLVTFHAGAALNAVTPGASLGEVLRGTLLRGRVPTEAVIASLVNQSYFLTISMMVTNVVGSALCVALLDLPAKVIAIVFGLAVLFLVPLVVLTVLLRIGAARTLVRLVGRLPLVRLRDPEGLLRRAQSVDASIRGFRRGHPDRFRRLVGWLVLSRVFTVMEVWLYLVPLLPERSPAWLALLALLTETANQLITWAATIVPGGFGVVEGNAYVLFGQLGLGAVTGFALALVRRIRMLVSVAIGLVAGVMVGLPGSARAARQPGCGK